MLGLAVESVIVSRYLAVTRSRFSRVRRHERTINRKCCCISGALGSRVVLRDKIATETFCKCVREKFKANNISSSSFKSRGACFRPVVAAVRSR
jgi:hypothetical protein